MGGRVREEVKVLVDGLSTKINLSARSFMCGLGPDHFECRSLSVRHNPP